MVWHCSLAPWLHLSSSAKTSSQAPLTPRSSCWAIQSSLLEVGQEHFLFVAGEGPVPLMSQHTAHRPLCKLCQWRIDSSTFTCLGAEREKPRAGKILHAQICQTQALLICLSHWVLYLTSQNGALFSSKKKEWVPQESVFPQLKQSLNNYLKTVIDVLQIFGLLQLVSIVTWISLTTCFLGTAFLLAQIQTRLHQEATLIKLDCYWIC